MFFPDMNESHAYILMIGAPDALAKYDRFHRAAEQLCLTSPPTKLVGSASEFALANLPAW